MTLHLFGRLRTISAHQAHIADLRNLGESNKRARTHAAASRAVLDTEDARKLFTIDASIASLDELVDGLAHNRELPQAALEDARFTPVAAFDGHDLR